jgi:hypothetical protein
MPVLLLNMCAGHGMLGEMVAEKAGHALVEDTCTRAKKNGCNLLMQPPDKLKGSLAVSAAVTQPNRHQHSILQSNTEVHSSLR